MRFGPMRNHWHDPCHAQFRTLFNGPVHPVKFKNGEYHSDRNNGAISYRFAEFELHTAFCNRADPPAP